MTNANVEVKHFIYDGKQLVAIGNAWNKWAILCSQAVPQMLLISKHDFQKKYYYLLMWLNTRLGILGLTCKYRKLLLCKKLLFAQRQTRWHSSLLHRNTAVFCFVFFFRFGLLWPFNSRYVFLFCFFFLP